MNFSNEELYAMYGQFDTNITITFRYNSAAYQIFGSTLMGSIIYTEDQRRDLEGVIHKPPVARTDEMIRFLPSPIEQLTAEQYEQAERHGFLCSDIYEILSYNRPRTNVFTEQGEREIQNTVTVNFNARPQEINQISFGFLNSRFSRKEPLSPGEINKFMGLRKYFGMDNSEVPYKDLQFDEKEAHYHALNAKLLDLTIAGEDVKIFAGLIIERHQARERLIRAEIERSGGKLEAVAKEHGDQLKNLRDACHGFEEQVLLYGKRLVYMDLERFLHIYGRHVAETHLGGKFAVKTIFQYKYDDIIRIIHAVIESEAAAIQEHLATDREKNFIRMGKRSIYHEGHYYWVEIDPTGRLLTFHPYNNNGERD